MYGSVFAPFEQFVIFKLSLPQVRNSWHAFSSVEKGASSTFFDFETKREEREAFIIE